MHVSLVCGAGSYHDHSTFRLPLPHSLHLYPNDRANMSQTTLYYGAPAEEKTFQAYLVIGERSLLSNANEALWKSFKNAQVQPPDVVVDGKVDSMTTWSKNGNLR